MTMLKETLRSPLSVSLIPTGSIAVLFGRSNGTNVSQGCVTPPENRRIEVRIGTVNNYVVRDLEIAVPPLLWFMRTRDVFCHFPFEGQFIPYQLLNIDLWGQICFGNNTRPKSLLAAYQTFWGSTFDDTLTFCPPVYHVCSRAAQKSRCPTLHACRNFLLPECRGSCLCCNRIHYCHCRTGCLCCEGECSCATQRSASLEWIASVENHVQHFTQKPEDQLVEYPKKDGRVILKTSTTARGFVSGLGLGLGDPIFARPVAEVSGDWLLEESQEIIPAAQLKLVG